MNYPWNILGIERTEDQKSIKRAYARLLRSNKPDENPDGFTQLNAAFKQAIDIAGQYAHKNQAIDPALYLYKSDSSDFSVTEASLNINLEEDDLEEHHILKDSAHYIHLIDTGAEESHDLTNISEQTDCNNDGEKHALDEILELIEAKNYNLSSWRMVLNKPHMLLDGRYIEQASYCIFQSILNEVQNDKIHQKKSKLNKDKGILDIMFFDSYYVYKKTFLDNNIALLIYFDDQFNWTTDWNSLDKQFGKKAFHVVDKIEKTKINADGMLERWADNLVAKEIGPAYDIVIRVLNFIKKSLYDQPKSIKDEILQAMIALFFVLILLVLIILYIKGLAYLLNM